ncbi:MAG TPA: ParA family protein [Candidatus Binatia bacterium]|nr:ParA family protein [Candidatus Binatia bacterium]
MRRIIVLNAKGGCGKTTVATNVASGYAARGLRTALIDYDPQCSSLQWLKSRPAGLKEIQGVAVQEPSRVPLSGAWQMRIARDTERVVVDTQAGVRAIDLCGRLTAQDLVLIPIQPSAIDIRATADFIRDLLLLAKLRPQDGRIGIIGNRTRRHTHSFEALQRFLDTLRIPVLTHLRDSQNYAIAAETGMGIADLPAPQVRNDRGAWTTIFDWLESRPQEPVRVTATAPAGNVRPIVQGTSRPLSVARPASPVLAAPPATAVPAFLTRAWPLDPVAEAPPKKELN